MASSIFELQWKTWWRVVDGKPVQERGFCRIKWDPDHYLFGATPEEIKAGLGHDERTLDEVHVDDLYETEQEALDSEHPEAV
jgi:hypothetical protein